jgi:3-hydroxyacyl-CoA dehydrogenase/3a,7a,12a-trihydroxy-5b-cholest-24-enoyl-CoA hydratase
MSDLRFDGRVAIVTGAANGLGRSHALLLASRGAKVVVNDLGGTATGGGKSSAAADKVVEEIKAAGGEAVASYDSVEDGDKIVQAALDTWKRIDIVVNNAGILRDTSFTKMAQEDWDLIYRVHVLGAYRVTKAAWDRMREAKFGRVIFTASAAGIYGNFGQANYAMAKLGLVGFSNTLALEGRKNNVFANTIAPIAGSRLTETVLPKEITEALKPEYVSALVAYLAHESCEENGGLFEVGGGLMAKLRWERTEGKLFKLGKPITPEQVQKSWPVITDFAKATHPTDITSSMQPILGNLQSKSLGGNDFIDVDLALGYEFPPQTSSYDEKDLSLYALGVGAGGSGAGELQYVYENDAKFCALPTFGVVPALKLVFEMAKKGETAPGMNYGFDRILHGEQYTEVKRPLPPHAKLTHKAKVKNIFDKGKGAVVVTAITSYDEDGNELVYNELSTYVRGAGGWGGDRGPSTEINVAPDRKPDAVVTEKISEGQALLYRLSGDINPLHVDPAFAKAFGFDRPILHGLCTFGFAARHVIKEMAKNDPRYFKSIKVRFSDSVFPGETLQTEMWKEADGRILFRCKVKERDRTVISNAAIELYKEIPIAPAKKAPAAAGAATATAAAAPSGEPTSAEAFAVIRDHIERNTDLASQIQKTFLFKLTDPGSAWTVDLKNGKGAVTQGDGKADCTLEISDADFRDLVAGKADPQKLYFGGKMKISGDVMASQKLMFLKKIDAARAIEVVKGLRGGGGGGGGAKAAGAGALVSAPAPGTGTGTGTGEMRSAKAPGILKALGERVAKTPGLAKEIGAVVQIVVTAPDGAYLVDLKNGAGSVKEGTGAADVTLRLSDEDLEALARGEGLRDLYQRGRIRIDGDVRVASKLDFFKGLV